MSDLIERRAAIEMLEEQLDYLHMLNSTDNPTAESNWYGVNWARNSIAKMPSAEPDNKLQKIADLVDGTIDHFDLDDAMDLLYQIKDILRSDN